MTTRANRKMQNAKRMLFAIFSLLFALSPSWAISDNAGTTNGDFLELPTDARGVALGPAIVSMADGAESLRWNPGALGQATMKEFDATHVQYFQGVQVENMAAAYPLEDGALAANVMYLTAGALDGRDTQGQQIGNFTFSDTVGSIGYGRRIMSQADGADVFLGAAVKIVQETIASSQFQNEALDLGVQVNPNRELKFGAAARNLSSSSANFPREFTGGASYTVLRIFTGGVGVRYTNDAPIRISVAGEYKVDELNSALRIGYMTHDPLDNSTDSNISFLRSASLAGLTAGMGGVFKPPQFPRMKLSLDYAIAPFGALGISHYVTVKVKW